MLNGDEIITRFEEETTDTVTVSRPLALTMSPQGLGMIPWCFLGDAEKITLRKDHFFFMVLSRPDATSQYLEGTTGISLVK